MTIFTDQCGNNIQLNTPPRRIISLVPSQTELLFDLELADQVVGITKFCVHPLHWRHAKTVVGGTKQFDFNVIDELQPDLIIGNKEENYQEGIEILQRSYPVWLSDIFNLTDALDMIAQIGAISNRSTEASKISFDITAHFSRVTRHPQKRVLYLIWRKPWMAAGRNTFIHSMLETIGLSNATDKTRYPELTVEEMQKLDPELILLSSEPFPFREKNIDELQRLIPNAKILLVDGEMFSWYGSRLRLAVDYFNRLEL